MSGSRFHHVAGISIEVPQLGASGTVDKDPEPHGPRWLSVLRLGPAGTGDRHRKIRAEQLRY
ncbi:putative pyridoxine 5'-phosphate oxidase superfamily flavin-nucleotide-binding protein [Rhodococcus opacus]|nr:putative pyridoxine 5'-phosphate oxidase superfamily flavin-nucleotide-binding protein [Rhodococcus opacus]